MMRMPAPTFIKLTLPGSNYCGPGGNGTPTDRVDAGCAAHDRCYENGGVSASDNINPFARLNALDKGVIRACDSQLCVRIDGLTSVGGDESFHATVVSTWFSCSAHSLRPTSPTSH
jgi:hypothetical protein